MYDLTMLSDTSIYKKLNRDLLAALERKINSSQSALNWSGIILDVVLINVFLYYSISFFVWCQLCVMLLIVCRTVQNILYLSCTVMINSSYILQQLTQLSYKDFDYLEYYNNQSNNNNSLCTEINKT